MTNFLFRTIALIAALSIHEFAHSFAAVQLGDETPEKAGRVTLNPLAHLDPLGTIFLFLTGFGWGKPVPVNPYNFENPPKDMALTALAGPLSNLILAGIISLISPTLFSATYLIQILVIININLGLFNLLPIYPLDGFDLIGGALPSSLAQHWYSLQQYGPVLLILLLLPLGNQSLLQLILTPPIQFLTNFLL